MDRNFLIRSICGWSMFIVAVIAMYTFDMIPFKVLYILFAVISCLELLSFFKRKFTIKRGILALLEVAFLVCSSFWVSQTDVVHFWYIILGVCGYDIFAYLTGRVIGGKIFKKSRPFPHISKNKTWEGTVGGLLFSLLFILSYMAIFGDFATDGYFCICGVLALIGDLFESYLKRQFDIKDSNEVVIKNKVFQKIEYLVGGTEGHGGFLDRIDSTAFSVTILLIIGLII